MISDPLSHHRRFAVAPMMELTDRHFRYLARLLTKQALLYSEMLTCQAVIHGDQEYLLGMHEQEHPTVLQLGGCDPALMAQAARIGEQWGYSEINMNVGCPSDRVKAGRFGACLMAEPELVRDVVSSMRSAVAVPVSVKCRLGIDREDRYDALQQFVETVAESGCRHFIVHARKAWLDGLSPKENRTVPPLRYHYVHRLKQQYPSLHITINGGLENLDQAAAQLQQVDGVMLGRAAYYHPAILASVDPRLYDDEASHSQPDIPDMETMQQAARDYAQYMQSWVDRGVRLNAMTRHLVALFQQVPGARQWRRYLSENASGSRDAVGLVEQALTFVQRTSRQSA